MKSSSENNKLSKSASKRKRSRQEEDGMLIGVSWPPPGQEQARQLELLSSPTVVAETAEAAATPPSAEPALSKVAKAYVDDELAKFEKELVQLAILDEKKEKLQAMVDGSREVPREYKADRSLPSLGSFYDFSRVARLEAEEMGKRQDHEYVEMLLRDLTVVSNEAWETSEKSMDAYRQKALNKVSEEQKGPAESYFNVESVNLAAEPKALLQKRRPAKRKRQPPSSQRPSKRPRKDEKKKTHHHYRQKPKNKRQ